MSYNTQTGVYIATPSVFQFATLDQFGNGEVSLGNLALCLLGTDRRCEDSEIPLGDDDPRGWWGDDFGGPTGSRLWLLQRSATTQDAATLAESYIIEALQPMIDQGMVESLSVSASLVGSQLRAEVVFTRPDGSKVSQKWVDLWAALAAEV